jgi:hypothetical protein
VHWLFAHCWFAPQRVLQSPQLFLSVERSTHAFPHCASPSAQPAEHVPLLQTCPIVHWLPHAPQLRGLVCKLSQTPDGFIGPGPPPPMHTVSPAGHPHTPFVHVAPVGQIMPHPPHARTFVSVSTQTVCVPTIVVIVHDVRPGAQPIMH